MSVARELQILVTEIRTSLTPELFYMNFDHFIWENVVFLGFPDAWLHNRATGGSARGYNVMILASTTEVHEGGLVPMAPVSWRSWKLERETTGTNDSDIQSM